MYLKKLLIINLIFFLVISPFSILNTKAVSITEDNSIDQTQSLPEERDLLNNNLLKKAEDLKKIIQSELLGKEYQPRIIFSRKKTDISTKSLISQSQSFEYLQIDSEEKMISELVRLRLSNDIEFAQPDYIYKKSGWTINTPQGTAVPSDFDPSNHWYHTITKVPELMKRLGCGTSKDQLCGGNSSVVVAVLDTGLAFENSTQNYKDSEFDNNGNFVSAINVSQTFEVAPDLENMNLWTNQNEQYNNSDSDGNQICDDLHGFNSYARTNNAILRSNSELGAWSCSDSTYIKEGRPNDDDGHGTFVTSIIAGNIDNSPLGGFGPAYDVKIIPVKVLGYEGIGFSSSVVSGIYYAIANGAKVINMSLVSSGYDSLLEQAISFARSQNVLVVAASGNGNGNVLYPARFSQTYDNVIAVGATNNSGNAKASYSSFGSSLDVVAPVGEGNSAGNAVWAETFVNTTDPITSRDLTASNIDYRYGIGTSFAAPQVTAIVAIALSKNPTLSPSRIKTLLRDTTNSTTFSNQMGYGVVNFNKFYDFIWGPFAINGMTDKKVAMAEFKGRIYQAVVGKWDSNVYTRSSTDGINWTGWSANGMTDRNIAMIADDDYIYQSVVGKWDSRIYTRRSSNGTTWSGWSADGMTDMDIAMIKFGNGIYQAVIGKWDGSVYTRRSLNSGQTWNGWSPSGMSNYPVTFATDGTHLYQTVVGKWDNAVYYRRSTDGINWTHWGGGIGKTSQPISMVYFDNKLIQAVVGMFDNSIYIRRSTDGINWTHWGSPGTNLKTNFTPSFGKSDVLFQTILSGNNVNTRLSHDGINWSKWVSFGFALTPPHLFPFETGLIKAFTSGSGSIYSSRF